MNTKKSLTQFINQSSIRIFDLYLVLYKRLQKGDGKYYTEDDAPVSLDELKDILKDRIVINPAYPSRSSRLWFNLGTLSDPKIYKLESYKASTSLMNLPTGWKFVEFSTHWADGKLLFRDSGAALDPEYSVERILVPKSENDPEYLKVKEKDSKMGTNEEMRDFMELMFHLKGELMSKGIYLKKGDYDDVYKGIKNSILTVFKDKGYDI